MQKEKFQKKFRELHDWDLSPKHCIEIQKRLRTMLRMNDDFGDVSRVAGVDVGFLDNGNVTRAAVAVLEFPSLKLIEHSVVHAPTTFPYVPGLLSFREVPAILEALSRLAALPNLILCDGQGYAHPRRMGIACHLGLITDIPTIGVAKTRLIGEHESVPNSKGEFVELRDRDETIGVVLRTRVGVKPLYISAGHKISLETSIRYTMQCVTRFRLPETTRWAHRLASEREHSLAIVEAC